MAKYYVGDRLLFTSDFSTYHIRAGDTAEIVKHYKNGFGWCVRFDRDVYGHDCNIPDLIPRGYGWWLGDSDLDAYAEVVDTSNKIDISNTKLEEVL